MNILWQRIGLILVILALVFNFASCSSDKVTKNLINPSEQYIIECLEKIPYITEIEAVTEENDPNGQLNKAGAYTAHIYFSYLLVEQEEVLGDSLIEKGTDAGGSIEVYKSKEDANKRNDYLATFDGTVLASGSHVVIGTVVVRTSNVLTASQQNLLESNIIAALSEKDESIVNPGQSNDASTNLSNEELVIFAKQVAEASYLSKSETQNNLIEKGFPVKKVIQAIESCEVDWSFQALKRAESFEDLYATVYPLMIVDLLNKSCFTETQIQYALENCLIDWEKNAAIHLQDCINTYSAVTPLSARSYLQDEKGYSLDIVQKTVNKSVFNWNELAVLYVEQYHKSGPYAEKKAYIIELSDQGFGKDQIEYAIENCNIDWTSLCKIYTDHVIDINTIWFGFCITHGAYQDDSDSFKCPDCGAKSDGLSGVLNSSREDIQEALWNAGYDKNEATIVLDDYDSSQFEYSKNKDNWLARYCLECFINKSEVFPTKEEAKNKLYVFGFGDSSVQYSLSFYYEPDFSPPVIERSVWVTLAQLENAGYNINISKGVIMISSLKYSDIEFVITEVPNPIVSNKIYYLEGSDITVQFVYTSNSNYVYDNYCLEYDALVTLGVIAILD